MIPHADISNNELDDSEMKFTRTIKIPWYHHILLNRPLKVTLALLLTAVATPLLVYNFYFFTTFDLPPSDGYSIGTCLVQRENRIACGIGKVPQEECHPQCCYDLSIGFCFHRTPSRFNYIMDQAWNENVVLHPRVATVPFASQNSLTNIRISIDEISETHLTLKLYDSRNLSFNGRRLNETKYRYEVSAPELGIVINSTQGIIFNTARGPFIASDNIWEMSFILTNETMYGLGELPLKENMTKVLYNHNGGVTSIPLIYAKVNDTYHGLLFDGSAPTEISIHGENRIVIRSITNVGFTFHLFVGPTPKDIMKDLMKVTGENSYLDYWMLGAHICNELPDKDLNRFISNATIERLPYESLCGHGPIVFNTNQCNMNSSEPSIEDGADIVKRANKRYVPHVSPYILYNEMELNETESEEIETRTNQTCSILPTYEDIMLLDPETLEIYKGIVNEQEVIYPSYEATPEFLQHLWPEGVIPDGIVLENNWPLDQSEKTFNETGLPYFSQNFKGAFNNTPQMDLILQNSTEAYLLKHNQYSNQFANAFSQTFNETMFWSTSQWMNGELAISRQNISTSWTSLRKELVEAALGGISGHWFWSSPICGDTDNFNLETHASLCVKWYMAATYFPMIKVHSKLNPRYPMAFTGTHKALIIEALNHRLSLLPYFYTTLQNGPLLRPMFYQFPKSEKLHDLYTQFSVGDDLVIVPNLEPSQSHVHFWLPPGTWYELWSGLRLNGTEGEAVTMTTTESDFLTVIRGGSILAIQKTVRDTAEQTRFMSPFSLIIALDCDEDETKSSDEYYETCHANGNIFVTKNMTLEFEANSQNLTITALGDDFFPICDWNSGTWAYDIREISVYGLPDNLNNFDYHRQITTNIDFCHLETRDSIDVNLV